MIFPTTFRKLASTLQVSQSYSVKPAGLAWRSSTFFIVSTVALGMFTDLFMYGLIVPVLPFMLEDRVHLPKDHIQSAVAGLLAIYAGASVIFSPVAGIVADKTSTRQLPFLLGLMALALATVLLFMGGSMPILILARILQGISAAVVWTIGLALCLETVGPANLGKTVGTIFSFISVGNLVAPLLGGVLYEKAGYGGVLAIGSAILAVDLVMRLLVIEKKVARRYNAEDLRQIGYNEATDGDIENSSRNDQDSVEDGEEQPLLARKRNDRYKIPKNQPAIVSHIPILACIKDAGLAASLLVAFVQALLLGSLDATIPIVAQELFGFKPLKAGVLFLPLGAADLVLGPLAGWAVDRYGTKPLAVAGYAYLTPVLILLRLPHAGGTPQIILYGGLLGLCGAGLAIIGAPSIVEAGSVVEKYFRANPDFFGESGPYAQLYGLNSMVFSAGLAVGPELAGQLKETIGYGNANLVLGIICFVTSALCYAYIGGGQK